MQTPVKSSEIPYSEFKAMLMPFPKTVNSFLSQILYGHLALTIKTILSSFVIRISMP